MPEFLSLYHTWSCYEQPSQSQEMKDGTAVPSFLLLTVQKPIPPQAFPTCSCKLPFPVLTAWALACNAFSGLSLKHPQLEPQTPPGKLQSLLKKCVKLVPLFSQASRSL